MDLFSTAIELAPTVLLPVLVWIAWRVLDLINAHRKEKWARILYMIAFTAADAIEKVSKEQEMSPRAKKTAATGAALAHLRSMGIKRPSPDILSHHIEAAVGARLPFVHEAKEGSTSGSASSRAPSVTFKPATD